MIEFRELTPQDRHRVNEFYQLTTYKRPVSGADRVFVAEDDIIYGAARIESREGVQVLRGMYMHPEHVRKGIGAMLLESIEVELAKTNSYCIPVSHLLDFYGKAGFRFIEAQVAPDFLAARAEGYTQEGKDIVIMFRPAGTDSTWSGERHRAQAEMKAPCDGMLMLVPAHPDLVEDLHAALIESDEDHKEFPPAQSGQEKITQ